MEKPLNEKLMLVCVYFVSINYKLNSVICKYISFYNSCFFPIKDAYSTVDFQVNKFVHCGVFLAGVAIKCTPISCNI